MLAPFKLLPRQVGSLFVAGIQTPSLSISPLVAGMQSPALSIYARCCTLDFFTLGGKDRTNQENLVQSYRICLSSVLFKSVKAGFLPLLLHDGVFGVDLQLPRRLRVVHVDGVLHSNR